MHVALQVVSLHDRARWWSIRDNTGWKNMRKQHIYMTYSCVGQEQTQKTLCTAHLDFLLLQWQWDGQCPKTPINTLQTHHKFKHKHRSFENRGKCDKFSGL